MTGRGGTSRRAGPALDESEFGRQEYTPYQVYVKALYAYFLDDWRTRRRQIHRLRVELTQFREDAVGRPARWAPRHAAMSADSVGLGKT